MTNVLQWKNNDLLPRIFGGEALAAGEVLLRWGPAVPRSEAGGVRGLGRRTASSSPDTGGSAGEEASFFEYVSTNPFPRLTRLLKYLFLGPKAGYDPSWTGLEVHLLSFSILYL